MVTDRTCKNGLFYTYVSSRNAIKGSDEDEYERLH